jgi:integrase
MGKRHRRKFTDEFKAQTVKLIRESRRTVASVARATDFAPVRGSTVLRGRAIASYEVAALFHVCSQDSTPAGPRDAVILALGVAAGLRRAEIASLDLADLDLSVASELAGHSSPSTTKRYDRRGERARHAAAETIVVPYVWRERGA